jgi:hypothetical protein
MAKLLKTLLVLTVLAVGALQAGPILVTSPGALGPNDSVNWSQLGPDATIIPQSFSATSANSLAITGSLAGANGCLGTVGGGACFWPSGPGFTTGDSVIWAEDQNTNVGSGPLTLGFPDVLGAGAYIQATASGQFTAQIEAFDGNSSLGTFTETSDANGDGIFVGVLDGTADVTSIQLSLTACGSFDCDPNDFAVNALQLAEQQEVSTTPEPASMLLLGTGLLGLASRLRKSRS